MSQKIRNDISVKLKAEMPALKIVVVEDEVVIAEHIVASLRDLGYAVPEPAFNYWEAISLLNMEKPDLVLLDIRLNDTKDGIDLANYINQEMGLPFIFLTANADRLTVDRAKITEPAAYLIKPFTKNDLYASIEVAILRYKLHGSDKGNDGYIFLKDGNVIRKTALHEITYMEVDHVYVSVHTYVRKILIRSSIPQMQTLLGNDPRFMQVHRSYIINLHHVSEVRSTSVIINDQEIPVSKTHRNELMIKLSQPKG